MRSDTEADIIGIEDVAKLLKVSSKTIRRNLATIPHVRVGRTLRFSRDAIVYPMRSAIDAKPLGEQAPRPGLHPRVAF